MICTIKHSPSSDPKFHHDEIFTGAGRSTKALLTILNKGCLVRKGLFISINLMGVRGRKRCL